MTPAQAPNRTAAHWPRRRTMSSYAVLLLFAGNTFSQVPQAPLKTPPKVPSQVPVATPIATPLQTPLQTSLPAPTAGALWSGQAQCQLSMQSGGYTHQETQTWTITGATQSAPDTIQVYPGKWITTGSGGLQKPLGLQILAAQWTTKAEISAPMAVFIRASDSRLIIKPWHAQLNLPGGTQFVRQISGPGAPPVPSSTAVTSAWEWQFPDVEDVATSTSVTGSSTMIISGSLMPQQAPSASAPATCNWQFTKRSPAPAANAPGRSITHRALVGGAVVKPASASAPATSTPPASTPATPAAPSVSSNPTLVPQSQQGASVALTGQNTSFQQGVTTADFGPGITVVSLTVSSATSATAIINVDPAATLGLRPVKLTTGSEQVLVTPVAAPDMNDFSVVPGPVDTSTTATYAESTTCNAGETCFCKAGYADCNGNQADGCETRMVGAGASCACNTPHLNGVGQVYADCTRGLGTPGKPATYNDAMAVEAASAFSGDSASVVESSCAAYSAHAADVNVVTATSNGACAVWTYTGSEAGHVVLDPSGNCYCPTATDNAWQ